MGSVKENLIAARALIDAPEKWGKGNGHFILAGVDPNKNCALTALAQAAIDRGDDSYGPELKALEAALPRKFATVYGFNDHRATTHADVIATYDRAIASQEKGEGE